MASSNFLRPLPMRAGNRGYSLIEVAVTLIVVGILLAAAAPSFIEFRQRSAIRAAAEQTLSFWNQARFEAAKRNVLVKVSVFADGDQFCLGAATTTNVADDTPCDCLDQDSGECDIAFFPVAQSEWRGVTLADTPTLGQDTGAVVVEPKRGGLTDAADAGVVALDSPPGGQRSYTLNLNVDRLGRGVVCESNTAQDPLPEYLTRRCDP